MVVISLRVLAVLPLQKKLGRHRDTEKIEAVVRDGLESLPHIAGPHPVENIASGVIPEPVAARKPDLGAVHVDYPVTVGRKPVVSLYAPPPRAEIQMRRPVCR